MFRALLVAVAAVVIPDTALADSPIVRDAVGRVAGYYAGGTRTGFAMQVVSPTGYTFGLTGFGLVSSDAGVPDGFPISQTLFYQSSDCTGQAYFSSTKGFSGFVVRSLVLDAIYYVPKGTMTVERTFQSVRTSAVSCQVPSVPTALSVEALPNDESVTGVPDADFVPPIEIVIARDVSDVFRNGYEAPKT